MSGIDAHVSATEPLVIDGLQYKLKPNGEYVTKRESVTFHPSGSNVYQPVGGTRVLRIVISDGSSAWLDPETVKLQMDVINTDTDAAKRLRPIAPWCFFKKVRISAGGALIEDFDYARTHEMFHMMKSKELRENDEVKVLNFQLMMPLVMVIMPVLWEMEVRKPYAFLCYQVCFLVAKCCLYLI